MLLFLGCIHTAPLPVVEGKARVEHVYREFADPVEGGWCSYDAESLFFGQTPLWWEEPPDAPNGCRPSGEVSRLVDIYGQNGPYLSVVLREWGCCPEQKRVQCVTYQVQTGQPVDITAYDEKHAQKRQIKAQKEWERRGAPQGYTLQPESFLIDGSHVIFCAISGEDLILLPVP